MAGIDNPNLVTYLNDPTAVLLRNAEYPDGSPLNDASGDGGYNTYLGMNRAASNAPGIGINTGDVTLTAAEVAAGVTRPETWTELDQDEAARIPQVSSVIGNEGFINRSSVAWPSSGGSEGKADEPVRHIVQPAVVPGTVDVNDTANLVITDTAAADGAVMDTVSGAVNDTGATVGIGDLVWGKVPVA